MLARGWREAQRVPPTFFRTTNSFSTAECLLISSSYLRDGDGGWSRLVQKLFHLFRTSLGFFWCVQFFSLVSAP